MFGKTSPRKDRAVSPVIGVMLMLVATVVVAAVVQSYAGGLATSTPKAPQASFDVKIKNTGYWRDSGIFIRCLSTDEPIPSKDVKIVMIHRGNVTEALPLTNNVNYTYVSKNNNAATKVLYSGPIGYVNDTTKYSGNMTPDVHFGNYTIDTGVMIKASPMSAYGAKNNSAGALYQYFTLNETSYCDVVGYMDSCLLKEQSKADPVQALLKDWEFVRPGDIVTVQIVHIPSGKVIFSKDVVVEG